MRYHLLYTRAAFFLFCIAPTVYTVFYLVERQLQTAVAAVEEKPLLARAEQELAGYLGVKVTVGGLEYQGNVTRISNLELHDPETDALLATADTVELYIAEGGELAIEPVGVTVQSEQLSRLGEILHGRVLRELPAGTRIEAGCPSVQIIGGPREESLADVNVSIGHGAEQRFATITFRPAWDRQREPLKLEIIRETGEAEPVTRLALHTGEQALETAWFAFCLPKLSELGDTCKLRNGILAASETSAGWETTFQGQLEQVELDRVVARPLRPFPLGTAGVTIDHARWQRGRLAQASGVIEASSLQIGWDTLIESLPALNLRPQQSILQREPLRRGTLVENGHLNCRFSINASGLTLLGPEQFVLSEGDTPLLAQPENKLSWTQSLLELCMALGMPAVEFVPPEFFREPSGVNLRDRST